MTTPPNKVVDLFRPSPPTTPEPRLNVSHIIRSRSAAEPLTGKPALDLTGKRRLIFVVGAGNTGKSLWLRWACERALGREGREVFALATADLLNRDLGDYFDAVMEAPVEGTGQWLSQFMSWLMGSDGSGAINFGGTDTSLALLAQEIPDLPAVLSEHGIEPVLMVFLSPRIADLTAYQVLEAAGFHVPATALVCNLGTVSGIPDPHAFEPVTQHSVFRAAVERGAAHVWMPRLFGVGPAIERARVSFAKALKATGDDTVLDILSKIRLTDWLRGMEAAFKPIASWLP